MDEGYCMTATSRTTRHQETEIHKPLRNYQRIPFKTGLNLSAGTSAALSPQAHTPVATARHAASGHHDAGPCSSSSTAKVLAVGKQLYKHGVAPRGVAYYVLRSRTGPVPTAAATAANAESATTPQLPPAAAAAGAEAEETADSSGATSRARAAEPAGTTTAAGRSETAISSTASDTVEAAALAASCTWHAAAPSGDSAVCEDSHVMQSADNASMAAAAAAVTVVVPTPVTPDSAAASKLCHECTASSPLCECMLCNSSDALQSDGFGAAAAAATIAQCESQLATLTPWVLDVYQHVPYWGCAVEDDCIWNAALHADQQCQAWLHECRLPRV